MNEWHMRSCVSKVLTHIRRRQMKVKKEEEKQQLTMANHHRSKNGSMTRECMEDLEVDPPKELTFEEKNEQPKENQMTNIEEIRIQSLKHEIRRTSPDFDKTWIRGAGSARDQQISRQTTLESKGR